MHLSTHTAQALNNVPARYDPARLRRPTIPLTRRGCPLLGDNLDVTETVPATEMRSVAEAAPATVLTTAPTDLRRSLRRFADGSRPPTPEGSRPGFPWSPVATPIRPITGRLSLAPSSSARCPIGLPYGSLSPTGGQRVYHVASLKLHGLGPASTPVARHLRGLSSEHPNLATYLLVQAYQHLWLVLCDDAYSSSPGLTVPRSPGPQPP
jgi:hypothetical protein